MTIEINKSLEVTRHQYNYLRVALAGLIFHRIKNNKYFVMPVLTKGVVALKRYFDD